MTDLGLVDADTAGTAFSINAKDQVVGRSTPCTQVNPDDSCNGPVEHAFLWENGSIADLQTLVVAGSDLTVNAAWDINDRGEIAGNGTLPNGDTHAVLLIPCGEGDEECGGDSPTGVTQNNPAAITQRPSAATPANPALSDGPTGMLDWLRSRWGQRYHFPGSGTGPTN